MTRIIREAQLGASKWETFVTAIAADLMAQGFMRSVVHSWEDRVTVALGDHGEIAAAIVWRVNKWNRSAFITIGGTAPHYRRRGIYRALFEDLVADIRDNHPEADHIDSGHHVDNHESQAMHLALGRRLDGLSYTFPIHRSEP